MKNQYIKDIAVADPFSPMDDIAKRKRQQWAEAGAYRASTTKAATVRHGAVHPQESSTRDVLEAKQLDDMTATGLRRGM